MSYAEDELNAQIRENLRPVQWLADEEADMPDMNERRWLEEHVQYLPPEHSRLNARIAELDVRKQSTISDSAFITGIVLAGLSIVAVLVWVLR